MRSFPIGGYLKGKIGKSFPVWGKPTGKIPIYYGFIRPSIELKTSYFLNGVISKMDFYPISPIGFYAGIDRSYKNLKNLDTFNCDLVACKGEIKRDFWGYRFGLAYQKFFLTFDFRKNFTRTNSNFSFYADELTSLLGQIGQEVVNTQIIIFGKSISKNSKVGLLNVYNKTFNFKNTSSMSMLIGQFAKEKWNYIIGGGFFHTRDDQRVFSILFVLNWKGKKGLLLF